MLEVVAIRKFVVREATAVLLGVVVAGLDVVLTVILVLLLGVVVVGLAVVLTVIPEILLGVVVVVLAVVSTVILAAASEKKKKVHTINYSSCTKEVVIMGAFQRNKTRRYISALLHSIALRYIQLHQLQGIIF